MKYLLITYTTFFLMLTMGCKKDNNFGTGADTDMTAYYIPCKTTYRIAGKNFQMASAYHYKPLAQGGLYYPGGGYETFEYQLRGGRLTHSTAEVSWLLQQGNLSDFKTNNPNFSTTDYRLAKIPDTDAFAGKEFRVIGSVVTVNHQNGNSSNVSPQEFHGLRFAAGRFYVTRQGGETNTGSYTLQNNGIATARTGSAGTLWLFVADDDNLHFACVYQDRTQYGTFGVIR